MERLRFEECNGCQDWNGCISHCMNICGKPIDALEKFNEYKALKEQGKLLRLPCKVGDTVWYINERSEKQGRKKVTAFFVCNGCVDHITLGDVMIPQIEVCNNTENSWITFDYKDDWNKIVFLTKEEAEAALKKMEESDSHVLAELRGKRGQKIEK